MMLNGNRWQFESTILKLGIAVRLNAHETLMGVSLARPKQVEPSQRRDDYRISLAGFEPIELRMVAAHPDIAGACLLDGPKATGRIIDLSAGGMAVLVKRGPIREFKRNELYYLSASLPGLEVPFELLGSVSHARLLHEGLSLRVSFAFADWGLGTLMSDQSRIARFIADCQRNRMRRRK